MPDNELDQLTEQPGNVAQPPSLKQRTIHGSLWTLAGYGSGQVLRLAGNLVFTRLLAPEVFGLMALVQTFLAGLNMFSDFGIFPSIVQSKRGDEPAFLNTAWTIQVIRGVAIWLVACVVAAPIAHLYQEPLLMQLLPVTALTSVIGGMTSTKFATANRQLAIQRLILIELGTSILTLMFMVVMAWFYRSVWVFVIGGIIHTSLKTCASFVLIPGAGNRFYWDQEAVQGIRQFGRWIFLSTIIAFFGLQSDRLVLGWLLDIRFLGVYTIALGLSSVVEQIVEQVNSKVLFPSYAELIRERPQALYHSLKKARLILIGLSAVCAIFLVFFGKPLIDFMYDDRYSEAGWILRVLSVGFLGRVLCITYGDILLARGETFWTMALTLVYTAIQLIAMPVGYYLGGYVGVIISLAMTEWLTYLAYASRFARLSLYQPELDLPTIALASLLTFVIYFT